MSSLMNEIKMGWTPYVTEETHSGTREICLQTRHFSNRRLFLTGEVTDEMANNFVSELLFLAETNEPVEIILNSCGGSVMAGMVIYDMIQACDGKVPISIYCTGYAASMGAIIFCGCPKGQRFILPNSKVMLHEPLIEGAMGGSATYVRKTAESMLETSAMLNKILSKHTGRSLEEIEEATSYDHFYTAEEAVKFGLCDDIRSPF